MDKKPDSQSEESKSKRKRRRRKKGPEKSDDSVTLKSDLPLKNGGKQVSTSDKHLMGSEVTCEVNDQVSPPTTAGKDGEVIGQPTETLTNSDDGQESCSSNGVKMDKECGKTWAQGYKSGRQ